MTSDLRNDRLHPEGYEIPTSHKNSHEIVMEDLEVWHLKAYF